MNSSNYINEAIRSLVLMMMGVIFFVIIISHRSGGIAGLTVAIGAALCFFCLINPNRGTYIFVFLVFYLDFIKKLAVVYGVASTQTVMEILIIQVAALFCIGFGTILRLVLFEQRLNRWHITILILTIVGMGLVFALHLSSGLVSAFQAAIYRVGYALFILPLLAFFTTRESLIKLFNFMLLLAVPFGLYGTYQYFFGFTDLEWEYARTFLSPVSSAQMLMMEKPRPFGFASGEGGYGAISYILLYAVWQLFNSPKHRILYGIASLILLAGLITSEQRTIMLLPIVAFFMYKCAKTKFTARAAVTFLALLFIGCIMAAGQIRLLIPHIDNERTFESDWANRVVKVGTLTDRVLGWERLGKIETYTLFGKRWSPGFNAKRDVNDEDYSHDMINEFLNNVGIIGAGSILFVLIYGLNAFHLQMLNIKDPKLQKIGIFFMAAFLSSLLLNTIIGSNLHSTPINIIFWGYIGGLVTVVYISKHPVAENLPLSATTSADSVVAKQKRVVHRMRPKININQPPTKPS